MMIVSATSAGLSGFGSFIRLTENATIGSSRSVVFIGARLYTVAGRGVDNLINNLNAIVGRENVLSKPDELLVYECDGLPQDKHRQRDVVFPASTEETAGIMHE